MNYERLLEARDADRELFKKYISDLLSRVETLEKNQECLNNNFWTLTEKVLYDSQKKFWEQPYQLVIDTQHESKKEKR